MSKVIGLDLSTNTGWAVLQGSKLTASGLIELDKRLRPKKMEADDYQFIDIANDIASKVYQTVIEHNPDKIYIEQTNRGKNRTWQKLIEFIHYAVLTAIRSAKMHDRVVYIDTSEWRSVLGIRMTKEDSKKNKLVRQGKVRGKITAKHLAVRWVNETFALKLKLCNNDIADAICVCACGLIKSKKIKDISEYQYEEVLKKEFR